MATNHTNSEFVYPGHQPFNSRITDKPHSILSTRQLEPENGNEEYFFRIGSIIDATTYRGVLVPKGVLYPNSTVQVRNMLEVLKIEKMLRKLYNAKSSILITKYRFKEISDGGGLKKGTNVAVRRSAKSLEWHRGTICDVNFYQDGAKADVLMVDYGDVVLDTSVFACVRIIPKQFFQQVAPLSLIFQIADIVPIEMSLNRDMGMKTMSHTPARNWSSAATDIIVKYILASPAKLLRIFNCVVRSGDARIFGQVELLGFEQKVFLQQVLISMNFGMMYPGLHLISQEVRLSKLEEFKSKYVEMVEPDFEGDEDVIEEEEEEQEFDKSAFSEGNDTFRSASSHVTSGNQSKNVASSLDQSTSNWNPTYYRMKKRDYAFENLPKFQDFATDVFKSQDVSKSQDLDKTPSDYSFASTSNLSSTLLSETSFDASQTPKTWAEVRQAIKAKDEELERSLCDSMNDSTISTKLQIRKDFMERERKQFFLVPAGTDLGKDMEERLKRIPDDESSGIGPKQLRHHDHVPEEW